MKYLDIATTGLVFAALAVAGPVLSSDRMDDGKAAYEAACASCHDSGAHSAPVTGRKQDWEERSHLWEAVLFEHANEGYLDMPAKGGQPGKSEYDIDAAAEYMLTITHPDLAPD